MVGGQCYFAELCPDASVLHWDRKEPLVKRDLEILPDALREHVNALAADIGPRTLLDRAFCPAARSVVGHKQTL